MRKLILALVGVLLGVAISILLKLYQPLPEKTSLSSPTPPTNPPKVVAESTITQINPKARALDVPIIMYHDVRPIKDVDWDITPKHLEKHFKTIAQKGLTPITLEQLVEHLRTNAPLPNKPILLTFDDNYLGEYLYAFPLLKKYHYPAVWSVHTHYVGSKEGKPKATWDQLKEMNQSGLITVASHTVNHLRLDKLTPEQVDYELTESKRVLEKQLGVPVKYFTYPEGDYIDSVKQQVVKAGYQAALSMSLDEHKERFANKSEDLLSIMRYGQSRFEEIVGNIAS
jgi:peptidoglycan/xylan/chitin deacetylase (PgdA/CDA1 family)